MIEDEIAFLRGLSKPYRKLSYGELSEIVNASYAKTSDIRETMKETHLSFDEVCARITAGSDVISRMRRSTEALVLLLLMFAMSVLMLWNKGDIR